MWSPCEKIDLCPRIVDTFLGMVLVEGAVGILRRERTGNAGDTKSPHSSRRLFTVTNVAAGVCGGGYGRSGFFQASSPAHRANSSSVIPRGNGEKRASVLSRPAEETLAINNNNLNFGLTIPFSPQRCRVPAGGTETEPIRRKQNEQ